MRTKKMTRVSFSGNNVSVTLPRDWSDLSQTELKTVYRLMSGIPSDKLPTFVFFALTGAKVVRNTGKMWVVRFRERHSHKDVALSSEDMLAPLSCLAFLSDPGSTPVRLDVMRGASAVNPALHGVQFGDYLRLENTYQGFLLSRNPSALLKMAQVLYPGLSDTVLSPSEELCVLQWTVQLKNMFAVLFNNFFRTPERNQDSFSQTDVMNAQIRALTQGDVTKETAVLGLDCWRALTELDALALEAAESKSKIHKK